MCRSCGAACAAAQPTPKQLRRRKKVKLKRKLREKARENLNKQKNRLRTPLREEFCKMTTVLMTNNNVTVIYVVMPILTLPLEKNGLNAENVRIGPICNVLKMKKA